MAIDWGALLPAPPTAAPVPARPVVQTHAPGTNAGGADGGSDGGGSAGEGGDREAWEERAAIIEFEGGQDRRTAEALATAEERKRGRAEVWVDRAGDDRRTCPECCCYQERRCTIAKPGGLVSAARGYMPCMTSCAVAKASPRCRMIPTSGPAWIAGPVFCSRPIGRLACPDGTQQPAQSPSRAGFGLVAGYCPLWISPV